jgi:hypothetical protein
MVPTTWNIRRPGWCWDLNGAFSLAMLAIHLLSLRGAGRNGRNSKVDLFHLGCTLLVRANAKRTNHCLDMWPMWSRVAV